jgi:hypothetical protein
MRDDFRVTSRRTRSVKDQSKAAPDVAFVQVAAVRVFDSRTPAMPGKPRRAADRQHNVDRFVLDQVRSACDVRGCDARVRSRSQ